MGWAGSVAGVRLVRRGGHGGALSPEDINDESRHMLIMDFERGRSQLSYTITVKLTHWSHEPWQLFAFAHSNPHKSQYACQQVLALGAAAAGSMHPAAAAIHQDPRLLEQVIAFADNPNIMLLED